MSTLATANRDLQTPFDIAVVIPTVLRPTLARAVDSVFSQDFNGRIQILIGIDVARGNRAILDDLMARCPEYMAITVLDLGYSTSMVNGGIFRTRGGGGLRTILSFAANSRKLAYLDDDNWWAPHHLSDLMTACEGKAWAFSLRWFVDQDTEEILCIDDFASVGPAKGIYREQNFHGGVDTNCYMFDRERCMKELWAWAVPFFVTGGGNDRNILRALVDAGHAWGETGRASVYYVLPRDRDPYPVRDQALRERGIERPARPGAGTPHIIRRRVDVANAHLGGPPPHRLLMCDQDKTKKGWLTATLAHTASANLPLDPRGRVNLGDGLFDKVRVEGVLERLSPRMGANLLSEIHRILKPGGRTRVTTPDLRALAPIAAKAPAEDVNDALFASGYRHLYEEPALEAALTAAGFEIAGKPRTGRAGRLVIEAVKPVTT